MRFVPVLLMLCLLLNLLAGCNQTGPSVTEPYVLTIMSALNPDNPGEAAPFIQVAKLTDQLNQLPFQYEP